MGYSRQDKRGEFVGILPDGVYLKLLWSGGIQRERFQDGPSFYRHVRGIAAGGEGRSSPNSESGGGW